MNKITEEKIWIGGAEMAEQPGRFEQAGEKSRMGAKTEPARAGALRVRSILVPTDLSPVSEPAIRYAAEFAARLGAKITLMSVVEQFPTYDLEYSPLVVPTKDVVADVQHDLDQMPSTEELDPALFNKAIVRTGVPFNEINVAAESLGVDLIILSTHGLTGIMRVWLGSTAERVVRHAKCPVLVVRAAVHNDHAEAHERSIEPLRIRNILVPTDFSSESTSALRYATRFALSFGASLHLVHVLDSGGATHRHVEMSEAQSAARTRLADLAASEIDDLVPVSYDVLTGKTVEEIVTSGKAHAADLIMIATHGRTGLKHVLLGSVTEQVVRHAPCPVLVVRNVERDFV